MTTTGQMSHDDVLRLRLGLLARQHRELDAAISGLETMGLHDQLTLQRLKKQKLALKDQIAQLSDRLIPDIIA